MSNLTRFNNQLDALINALLKIDKIKDDKKIIVFQMKMQGIRALDAKKPLECFLKFVYPYKEQIMKQDEEFFLGNKIMDRVSEISNGLKEETDVIKDVDNGDEFVLHEALRIQEHWTNNLSEEQKGIIWTYFQVLIRLTERYVAEKMCK
jgi:hypothetical protein